MTKSSTNKSSRRGGFISSIELLFVLPILMITGLVVLQFILIHTAYQRVQTAAIEGACISANGGTMAQTEDVVGLGLGYLASGPGAGHVINADLEGFEMVRQFIDTNGNGTVNVGDTVEVSVRIPMKRVSTNYLGLLGGAVDLLHLRSVVKKRIETVPADAP